MSHWPQYVSICLTIFNLFMAAIMDGQPKTGTHSAGVTMISAALSVWILWCGGYWEPILK